MTPFFSSPVLPVYRVPTSVAVLSRLRAETRIEHDAIENMLGLASERLTHAAFVRCISRFYGFYKPIETALAQNVAGSGWQELMRGRLQKTALLEHDLFALGVDASTLMTCSELPPMRNAAELLGCVYVLEGATLGGRVIVSLLQARLDLTASTGAGFFNGYGANTALMWQALRHALVTAAPDATAANEMIASANATFRALRRWCAEVPALEQA